MAVIPGTYNIAFGIEYSAGAPTPKPLYLTRNGEGKQLTVEHPTGSLNQAVNYYNKCCPMSLSANMFLYRSGTSSYR